MSDIQQSYSRQLQEKVRVLETMFADCAAPAIRVYASVPEHWRMRAEFRMWHDGPQVAYAMFERGSTGRADSVRTMTTFAAAHRHISGLMPVLLAHINASGVLRHRLYQSEFLTTLSGDTLVTLVYHRKLDDEWHSEAAALAAELGISIIGRSRGQKRVVGRDEVREQLTVCGRPFRYYQPEGAFTQPNALVCEKMLEWAVEAAQGLGGDLLELYCGNGNFTLPLSLCFDKVLATEVSKTSVSAAQRNIIDNGINNIAIARLSAEEFTQAYRGVRQFKRLKEKNIHLADYRFSTVFVDPPRAGIDNETLMLLSGFDNIIYVSCNPETLHSNVRTLLPSHAITKMALFDQFPFTPHMESAVLLQKKK